MSTLLLFHSMCQGFFSSLRTAAIARAMGWLIAVGMALQASSLNAAATRISGAIPPSTILNANQGVAVLSNGGHADLYLHQSSGDQANTVALYTAYVVVYDNTNTIVNTVTANESVSGETPYAASIAPLANGGFVVAWTSQDSNADLTYPAYYETFANDGTPADASGSRHHSLTSTAFGGYGITVAGLPNGGFVCDFNNGPTDYLETFSYGGSLTSFTRSHETTIGNSNVVVSLPEGSAKIWVCQPVARIVVLNDGSFIVEECSYVYFSGTYTPIGDFIYKFTSGGVATNFASGFPMQRVNFNYSTFSSFALAPLPGGGFATVNKDDESGYFEMTMFNADGSLITSSATNTHSLTYPGNGSKSWVAQQLAVLTVPNVENGPNYNFESVLLTGSNLTVALTNSTSGGGFNIGTYSASTGAQSGSFVGAGVSSVGGGFSLSNPYLALQPGNTWGITYDDYYFNSTSGYQTASVYQYGFSTTPATPSVTVPGGTTTLPSTSAGTASASGSFIISGSNLTGSPGTLTVTAPNSGVQVSADGSTNWGATCSIAYSTASLSNTNVYVRLSASASAGATGGAVSITGGGLSSAVNQSVSGTVNTALGIGTQPASVNIDNGQSTTLSVSASNGTTPYSYQWYSGASGITTNPIGGATSSTYLASPTTTTNYWVKITDKASATINSNTATVTVNTALGIGTQPASAIIDNGQSHTLSVSASNGTTSYSYQWYIGASGTTTSPISGATSNTYNAAPTSTTNYWVKVTDSANGTSGSASVNSSTATITVNTALGIGTQPASATIDNGQSKTLSVTPSNGTTPYSYQWYIGASGTTTSPISGATSSTYNAAPTSTTNYWVKITDAAGASINSNTATVTVNTALGIGTQPASATIDNGQSKTLSVTPSNGTTPYSYQWYIGASGTTTSPISGATSSTYNAAPTSTTNYWVKITDSANGTSGGASINSSTATLTVNAALGIGKQPASGTITSGGSGTLSVTPSNGTTPYSYQWYIGASGSSTSPIGGATNSTYNAAPTTTTSYWVKVTDNAGASVNSSTATVTVSGGATPTVTMSSTPLAANAATLNIGGTNFSTTPGNTSVTFTPAPTGSYTVSVSSSSSLTVTFANPPGLTAGVLSAQVAVSGNGNSGSAVQVATVTPVVTPSTGGILGSATTLTINGFGFDLTPGNNSVVFTPAGTSGTVTASTNTTLTVTALSGLTQGPLSAVVTTNLQSSGSSVQVATVAAGTVQFSSTGQTIGTGASTPFSFQVAVTPTASVFASGFSSPSGLAFDSSGNLYVANSGNNTISKVSPSGVVTSFASGFNVPGMMGFDSSGNLYVSNGGAGTVSKVTPGGVVSTFASSFNAPTGITVDSSNNVYVSNLLGTRVDQITPGGTVSSYANPFNAPGGLSFDSVGNLYVANFGFGSANSVMKLTPGGSISTYVSGSGISGPMGLGFDSYGNMYVSNFGGTVVSQVTPGLVVTPLPYVFNSPDGVAVDSAGNIYVANYGAGNVIKITGVVSVPFTTAASSGVTVNVTNVSPIMFQPGQSTVTISGTLTSSGANGVVTFTLGTPTGGGVVLGTQSVYTLTVGTGVSSPQVLASPNLAVNNLSGGGSLRSSAHLVNSESSSSGTGSGGSSSTPWQTSTQSTAANMAEGSRTGVADPNAQTYYYKGTDNRLWAMYAAAGTTQWSQAPLLTNDDVSDWLAYAPGSASVFYQSTNHDLSCAFYSNGTWQHSNLTGEVVAGGQSNVAGDVVVDTAWNCVYYRGTDNQLWAVYSTGQSWVQSAIGTQANVAGHLAVDSTQHSVYYTDANNQLWQASVVGSQWTQKQVSTVGNVGGAVTVGGSGVIYYRSLVDQSAWELSPSGDSQVQVDAGVSLSEVATLYSAGNLLCIDSTGNCQWLSQSGGQWTAALVGDGSTVLTEGLSASPALNRVYCRSSDGHIVVFSY